LIEYPQYHHIPVEYIKNKVAEFLSEDVPDGDKTSEFSLIDPQKTGVAEIQAVTDQVFVGKYIISHFFGDECTTKINVKDGSFVSAGDIIGMIKGPMITILGRERIMLNLVQRLCGIATLTRRFVNMSAHSGLKILDTRKTTPGLRLFEKHAVVVGGGTNHRLNLSTGILIKDNHIKAAGSVKAVVNQCKSQNPKLSIELEVDTLEQIYEGLDAGVDGFLLDNMNPGKTIEAVNTIHNFPGGEKIFIESSGGITLETLPGYLNTGINAVSVGALTHSVQNSDIRLEFI
jgi:nicotinate-nucleotide pyrophosphorylase (carboxylating)